ncbi:hypothetical protein RhiirA5_354048 [Rhizophagus irregularis]|uniref:Ricin B lectin domain-containing protein n=1 Tax=Rhizophagus irregularis TaxID=588596 RepID=A0A2N0PXE7_9GLOM|nr:hypothetical protein RhiirA5_354048 [Rhizophagus irregularis]
MKIKTYFLPFLFITHTYCALIPNNRVIINSDSTQDFNLVEGITYKIVHLKSGLNLDSNSNNIHVSSSFNPYQYWSLRKANENEYNIVCAVSSMNLDGNGQETYASKPGDNSVSNPYQRWAIKKVNNDTYNIVHVNSESRNLDSNGQEVYISSYENNSENNIYQHWSFEPSNYKLNAVVMDFEYPPDLKQKLDRYKTRTNLLSGSLVINNPTNGTIEQTVDKTEKKSSSYTLKIRKSESFKVTKNIGVSFDIGRTIFGILGLHTGFQGGIKNEFNSTHEEEYKKSVKELVSYRIRQKVEAPPLTSIMVNSSVDKINIDIPFKAKIRVTGKADRLDEYGRIVPMTDVDANALRYYLQKEYYDAKVVAEEGNSLIITTNGNFKIDGYGFNALVEAIPIKNYPSNPPSPPNLPNPTDPSNPSNPDPNVPNSPNSPAYPNPPNYSDHNPFSEASVMFYFAIYLMMVFSIFALLTLFVYKLWTHFANRRDRVYLG